MLHNQSGQSHLALRIVWKQLKEMSTCTLTAIGSYAIIELDGATSMPHGENGPHIKRGMNMPTDRQILKIFLSTFQIESEF